MFDADVFAADDFAADEQYHHVVNVTRGFALSIKDLISFHESQYLENDRWKRNTAVPLNVAEHHCKLASNARLEKDLLALLNIVCHNGVLNDIDDQKQSEFDASWNQQMKKLKEPKTRIENVVQKAIETHKYTFKRFQLKTWLEVTSDPFIEDTSIPKGGHWCNTLKILKFSTSKVAGMHPDAQYVQGALTNLEGNDDYQQKCLLRSIWQGIRAGNVADVIEMCKKHRLFWLAASLRGIELDNLHLFRYLDTCYKYSNALSADNSSEVTTYEREIYAFLCNNIDAMKSLRSDQEDYLQHWRNWMWVIVKADYEYDIWSKIYDYRKELATFSSLYPESDHLNEAHDFINKLDRQLKSVHKYTSNIRPVENDEVNVKDVYACLSDVVPEKSNFFERFILRLQVSLMRGYKGFKAFISGDITTFLDAPETLDDFERVKRIVCHLLLFLRENTTSGCSNLADLVPNDLLFKSIEVYVDYLISKRLYHLVPTYGKYLSKSRRINIFVQLLVSMQLQLHSQDFMNHKLSAKADEVVFAIQQALDDPQELVEIKKRVVERIKGGDSGGTTMSTGSPMPSRVVSGGSVAPASRAEVPITPFSTSLRRRQVSTPFIKSSAVKSKKGVETHTSMDISDNGIGSHESQKITSLHWLLQKDSRPEIGLLNKLEACKQANSMIISFLADELRDLYTDTPVDLKNKLEVVKTTLIELLTTVKQNYCPGVGNEESVDTIPLDYMLQSCERSSIPRIQHQYDCLHWNISMLRFWSRYWSIMNDLSHVDHSDDSSRSDYVEQLLDAILTLLIAAPGSYENGITVIWSECRCRFIQLFLDIVDDTVETVPQSAVGGAVYNLVSDKYSELVEAQRVISGHYPPSSEQFTRAFQERRDKLDEYLTNPVALSRRETNDVMTILENCKLILNHVHKCDEIINLVANNLLTEYTLLCMSEGSRKSHLAATEMDSQNRKSLSHSAVKYYERAVELSIHLANEGIGGPFRAVHGMHELQLFNRLSATHLEYLLKCMNNSSIEAMRLKNSII